jgi:cytochrome c biogenesis protein CcdA
MANLSTVADVATYGGSGVAVVFGLTPSEWQALGVAGGLLIAAIGLVAKVCIDIYFKRREMEILERAHEVRKGS